MKIAQVAPIWYRIPPKKYGGTELIVTNLTEELVKRNHEVTLFASGDSLTKARLKAVVPQGLLELGYSFESFSYPIYHSLTALEKADEFDILHFHFTNKIDYLNLALIRNIQAKVVVTLHVPLPVSQELHDRRKLLEDKFSQIPFVSISNNQRAGLQLHFAGTVYNSIEVEKFPFSDSPKEEVMVWMSRISYQKGAKESIELAISLNRKLHMIGKVDQNAPKDITYFESEVHPLLQNPLISLTGEADFESKTNYLMHSKLFLFPLRWEEPFGLVMIEAMACGTPVVAYSRGSVPEVVKDGVTGYIVNPSETDIRGDFIIKKTGPEGMKEAIERIYSMTDVEYKKMRENARKHVQDNFTVKKMVDGYEQIYEKLLTTPTV